MEELLKQIMGEDFKENMSKDDIESYFKKSLLSSGNYVNKGKSDADTKKLKDTISDLQSQLESKMTDDDKKKKIEDDNNKLIQQLKQQLQESLANQSKMKANSLLAQAKINSGVKDEDTDFDAFLSDISFEDIEKTTKVSSYIAKLVSNAYESGKNSAIKDKLGKLGGFNKDGESDPNNSDEGSLGKRLGQKNKPSENKVNFFERK